MTARKKLIVIGAHGFVAGSVLAQSGDEWKALAIAQCFGLRQELVGTQCGANAPGQAARPRLRS